MSKQLPYEPTTYTVAENRDLVGYDLILKCSEKDCEKEPGIVRRSVLRFGVSIVKFMLSIPANNRRALFLVVDMHGRSSELKARLLEELKKLECVEEASFSPRYRNIIYTRVLNPIVVAGKRSFIVSLAFAKGIAVKLHERFGKGLAPIAITSIGEEVGKAIAEDWRHIIGKSLKEIGEFLEIISIVTHQCSETKVIAGDKTMEIICKDLWEDKILYEAGLADENCNFIIGLLKGLVEEIIGVKADVREVLKQRKGSPHTKFVVRLHG